YDSYVSYRLYLDELSRVQRELGAEAIQFTPLPVFFDRPGFIEPNIEHVRDALAQLPADAHIAFTAHSIPTEMAENSPYVPQLLHVAREISAAVGNDRWELVYQSRSGNPRQPWLEPDISDHLETLAAQGVKNVVIAPIGFISDHMEVVYDLDTEARQKADSLGITIARAKTVGTHPRFVQMIREMVREARDW
ncbi:MAG TPA: ferrochelatase, partial [Anaerolineae bacterium]|nr:ferrochelatase [Anaerolineae bacterium]